MHTSQEEDPGHPCTERSCKYTAEQRKNAANHREGSSAIAFSEIICTVCKKKKWACSLCAANATGVFAFVNRDRHLRNRYAHSDEKRPSGIRPATKPPKRSVPKMKKPSVYHSHKKQFIDPSLLHSIHGYLPFDRLAVKNDNDHFSGSQRCPISVDFVRDKFPNVVWEQVSGFIDKGIIDTSEKTLSLWNNDEENTYTSLRMNSYSTLLIVVSGTGHRRVLVAKNPGDAKFIQDGKGVVWKRGRRSGDSVEWQPETSDASNELMQGIVNGNTAVSFTLVVGDALLVPSGYIHGESTYGVSSMLSIPMHKQTQENHGQCTDIGEST